jgi:hypothetical protein
MKAKTVEVFLNEPHCFLPFFWRRCSVYYWGIPMVLGTTDP